MFSKKVSPDFREFNFTGNAPPNQVYLKLKRLTENLALIADEDVPQVDVTMRFTEEEGIYEEVKFEELIHGIDQVLKLGDTPEPTDILCRLLLNIQESKVSASTKAYLERRQQELDISYAESLRKWHSVKMKPQPKYVFGNLLREQFPKKIPEPILTKNLDEEHKPKSIEHSEKISELKNTFFISEYDKSFNANAEPFLEFITILQVLPMDTIIKPILSFSGERGLENFCRHISIFGPEQLRTLVAKFFTGGREQEILNLLTPRGIASLETCRKWPPELIQHWLNWLNADSELNISFIETINILERFWLGIKDFHPKIPGLVLLPEPELAPPAGSVCYASRIETMLSLVDSTQAEFKKIQIEFLFDLDWTALAKYQSTKKAAQCFFICKQMLTKEVMARDVNEAFDDSSEAVFYQYVSSHIQDKSASSLQQIRQYALCAPDLMAPADVYWPFAAWCASLPQVMSKESVLEIYQWMIEVPQAQQKEILNSLFSIDLAKRFSSEDFNQFLTLANKDANKLEHWINFYSLWHDKQDAQLSQAWQVLMKNVCLSNPPDFLDKLFELCGEELTSDEFIFKSVYFTALCLLLSYDQAAEDQPDMALMTTLKLSFKALTGEKQSDILAVLSSYEREKSLSLQSMKNVLRDIHGSRAEVVMPEANIEEYDPSKILFIPTAEQGFEVCYSVDHIDFTREVIDPNGNAELIGMLNSYRARGIIIEEASHLNRIDEYLKSKKMLSLCQGWQLEAVFTEHFTDVSFDYFKSAIDDDLIFKKMDDLVASIQGTINFFLSDEKILGLFAIKGYLAPESVAAFQAQNEILELVREEIKKQKALKNNFDFSSLFANLKDLEVFLCGFVKQELNTVFNMSSWAVTGLFSTGLIKNLDKSLSASSTVQALMKAILDNHAKVASVGNLKEHFNPEMLQIIVESSDTPLMQRFLQKGLVGEIALEFEKKISRLQSVTEFQIDAKNWLKYLHELPLEKAGIEQFFQRYQSMEYVLKAWPELKFHASHDKQLLWDVLIKNQLENGAPYTSAYWKIALKVVEELIKLPAEGMPRMELFLDAFFNKKKAFKNFIVLGHGEIKHVHWPFLMDWFSHEMPKYVKAPLFLIFFPLAIEHILTFGTNFTFEEHLDTFAKMSKDPQLIEYLTDQLKDEAIKDTLIRLIVKFGELREKKDGLVEKILNASDFKEHAQTPQNIENILQMLNWLELPHQFPWVELIADDKDLQLRELIQVSQKLQEPSDSIWKPSYLQHYMQLPIIPQAAVVEPISRPSLIGSLISRWFSSAVSVDNPRPVQAEEEKQDQVRSEYAEHWQLWQQVPYPKVKQLNQWLSKRSDEIKSELTEFDCYPFEGSIKEYMQDRRTENEHQVKDMNACIKDWMAKLERYEYMPPDKAKIEQRWKNILRLTDAYFQWPRTNLKNEFDEKCKDIQENPHSEESQNALIAVIAAIYCKTTQKRPHPTQILTLLMMMEYEDKNIIFEVDTGEGKGITSALMAVLRWSLNADSCVEIRTATRDLVKQDFYEKGHWRFFKFLGIEHGIIQQDSVLESYNTEKGGIYYSTQCDMSVFYERWRQAGLPPIRAYVFLDEGDMMILDETGMIHIAKSLDMPNISWVYIGAHQFINNTPTTAIDTLDGFAQQLKEHIKCEQSDNDERLTFIDTVSDKSWKDWLILALRARELIENEHFVLGCFEQFGQKYYRAIPLVNGELKHGFSLSFQMDPELMQFLHARFHHNERRFLFERPRQVCAQITTDFKNALGLVLLTGFIGSLPEMLDIKESTNAVALRIPRNLSSQLKQKPDYLIDNTSALYERLVWMIDTGSRDPIWMVVENIQDAKTLFDELSRKNKDDRRIFLLTGQESEAQRRAWLHQTGDDEYAGSKNSITISTLAFGRGTDIIVADPYHLQIIEIDIFSPRALAQLDGRTARGSNKGSRQRFYNKEKILSDWRFIGSELPNLSAQSLSLWIEKIQSHIIFEHRKKRKPLLMQGWLQHDFTKWLNECFTHETTRAFTIDQKHQYYLMLWNELQDLVLSSRPEEMLGAYAKKIREKLTNKLILEGVSPDILEYIDIAPKKMDWPRIVSQVRARKSDHNKPQVLQKAFSKENLESFRIKLNAIIGAIPYPKTRVILGVPSADDQENVVHAKEILFFKCSENSFKIGFCANDGEYTEKVVDDKPLLVMLNACTGNNTKHLENTAHLDMVFEYLKSNGITTRIEQSSLLQYSENCLRSAWIQFNKNTADDDESFANWNAFYQCLLSTHMLYQQNRPEHLWQFGYWSWNSQPFLTWKKVYQEVNFLLHKEHILPAQEIRFYANIREKLDELYPFPVAAMGLWSRFIGWCSNLWKQLMSFFNSDIENMTTSLNTYLRDFINDPAKKNLDLLYDQLNEAVSLFDAADQWSSMRVGYWWYWKSESQIWIKLLKDLDGLFKEHSAHPINGWRKEQQDLAHLICLYRDDLINLEQSAQEVTYSGIFSLWSNSSQKVMVVPQPKFEQERVKKDGQLHDLRDVKMLELCRRYPEEINYIHAIYYPDTNKDKKDKSSTSYRKFLDVMFADNKVGDLEKAEPFKALNETSSKTNMKVLRKEIKACAERALLQEFDRHVPIYRRS